MVRAYFAVLIGVISVSTSAVLVKLSTAPVGVIAFYRLFFSSLFLAPLFFHKHTKAVKRFSKKEWNYSIMAGVFLAFHFILWFESLRYTSVASSVVIVTLQPLFSFVGAYLLFKERINAASILCGICALGGSFIISWGDFYISGKAIVGDALAFISCGLITAYLLLGQEVRKKIDVVPYTFVVYTISSITLFMYVLTKQEAFFSYDWKEWMLFILLAVFPTLLGHSLFNWALKYVSTSIISMAILFEPVGATVLAYFLLNEEVVKSQIAGGGVIFISVAVFLLLQRKNTLQLEKGMNSTSY
ncbi:DMT family transporter [Bacillus songklensis]|uniref:DMT family transporter n=1 Tax=Bacillus songklensis TaxID=1069116 RepID=A0ABV8B9Z6_9BACI